MLSSVLDPAGVINARRGSLAVRGMFCSNLSMLMQELPSYGVVAYRRSLGSASHRAARSVLNPDLAGQEEIVVHIWRTRESGKYTTEIRMAGFQLHRRDRLVRFVPAYDSKHRFLSRIVRKNLTNHLHSPLGERLPFCRPPIHRIKQIAVPCSSYEIIGWAVNLYISKLRNRVKQPWIEDNGRSKSISVHLESPGYPK